MVIKEKNSIKINVQQLNYENKKKAYPVSARLRIRIGNFGRPLPGTPYQNHLFPCDFRPTCVKIETHVFSNSANDTEISTVNLANYNFLKI